jgi:hypothetical protein
VDSWDAYDVLYLYGAQKIHGASLDMVKKGRLDESDSREMAIEMITSLVERQQYIFSRLRRSIKVDDIFPLVFEEIKKALLQRRLEDHFRDERAKYKKRRGLLTEMRDGNTISYVCCFDYEDMHWIENQVQEVLEGGPIPERLPGSYDRMEKRIDTCARTLGPETSSILAPIFPDLQTFVFYNGEIQSRFLRQRCWITARKFILSSSKPIELSLSETSRRSGKASFYTAICLFLASFL